MLGPVSKYRVDECIGKYISDRGNEWICSEAEVLDVQGPTSAELFSAVSRSLSPFRSLVLADSLSRARRFKLEG